MVHINLFPRNNRNNQSLNGMQVFSFYRKKDLPALLQRDGVDTLSKNVHPCTFADGEFLLRKNVAIAWNYRHPRPKMYVRVHRKRPSFGNAETRGCIQLRTSLSVLKCVFRKKHNCSAFMLELSPRTTAGS